MWYSSLSSLIIPCFLHSVDNCCVAGERVFGAVVVVSADHHREDVDNFDLVLDAARSSATTSLAAPSQPSPSVMSGTANGSTDEGAAAAASPQDETNGPFVQCVTTQNCQADQSATSLSPPVVSMATTHYTGLDEDDLPGGCKGLTRQSCYMNTERK